jgi:selenocysteine-specific elongation factor
MFPSGKHAQVKSLQSYGRAVKVAEPVSRVALQLSKIGAQEIGRGELLSRGKKITLSRRFDAEARFFLPLERRNLELSFHLGTRHEPALVIPLGAVPNKEEVFLRLKLESPLPLRVGDRFLLRTPGEERTIGAGRVLDPQPGGGSHRRAVESLARWRDGAEGLIAYQMAKHGFVEVEKLEESSPYRRAELESALARFPNARHIGPGLYLETSLLEAAESMVKKTLLAHHGAKGEPLGEGDLVRELASALKLPVRPLPSVFTSLVVSGKLRKENRGYWWAAFQRVTDPAELARRTRIKRLLANVSGNPLSLRELGVGLPDAKKVLWSMVKEGELVSLAEDHFVDCDEYARWKARVKGYLEEKGQATTSELRTYLNTSRKIAVLMLEQMDRDRVTFLKDGVRRLFR